jgi:hypothetical protein
MKPSDTSQALLRIASNIQNSKNPDRTLVARDLKKVLAALAGGVEISMSLAGPWTASSEQAVVAEAYDRIKKAYRIPSNVSSPDDI